MCSIGQQEVYDFLTHHKGKWFTSRDISEQLNVSIGSVTMSLKKLRKTNLIKYKNTGVRNTFIYTVEPEGVTVAPPPGMLEEKVETEVKRPAKQEKIVPKIVQSKKSVPIVVKRAPEKPTAKAKKPKVAKKTKPKKTIKKSVKKTTTKSVKKVTKKIVKSMKKAPKKVVKKTTKKVTKAIKKVTKNVVKKIVKKHSPPATKSLFHRLLRR